jgi:hypothetical protein
MFVSPKVIIRQGKDCNYQKWEYQAGMLHLMQGELVYFKRKFHENTASWQATCRIPTANPFRRFATNEE